MNISDLIGVRRWLLVVRVGLCSFLVMGFELQAQTENPGCVHGRVASVSSPSEGGLAGVDVELKSVSGNHKRSTTSGIQGEYDFSELEPGEYTVAVAGPDFVSSPAKER